MKPCTSSTMRGRAVQPGHDLAGQLEAQIHPRRANVKEQVAGRADRMPAACADLAERVQSGRPRQSGQPVPGCRAEPGHAGQVAVQVAEADRPDQPRQDRRTGCRAASSLAASG